MESFDPLEGWASQNWVVRTRPDSFCPGSSAPLKQHESDETLYLAEQDSCVRSRGLHEGTLNEGKALARPARVVRRRVGVKVNIMANGDKGTAATLGDPQHSYIPLPNLLISKHMRSLVGPDLIDALACLERCERGNASAKMKRTCVPASRQPRRRAVTRVWGRRCRRGKRD